MPRSLRRLLIAILILGLLWILSGWLRGRLGIALDVDSVRGFAEGLGPMAPALFVLLVAGRSLLALPSQVVLIAAGLCFGTAVGALVGGAGLMLSGLGLFLITRYAGRDTIEARMGRRFRQMLDMTRRRSGAAAFSLACGYPITPLSPLQAAAGLTPMPLLYFIVAAFLGGLIRAAIFAYFGNALTESSWSSIGTASGVFVVALLIPLAFPNGRQWLRQVFIVDATPDSTTDR